MMFMFLVLAQLSKYEKKPEMKYALKQDVFC